MNKEYEAKVRRYLKLECPGVSHVVGPFREPGLFGLTFACRIGGIRKRGRPLFFSLSFSDKEMETTNDFEALMEVKMNNIKCGMGSFCLGFK